MEAGLDTGPMLATVETPVARKTAGELTAELAELGGAKMVEVLAQLTAFPPVVQPDDGVTYAAKIDKAESRIVFAAGAEQVERQVRAFNPAPGAWFEFGGERFKLLAADVEAAGGAPGVVLDDGLLIGCGADSIRPKLVQRAGKGAMSPAELLRGFAIPVGAQL